MFFLVVFIFKDKQISLLPIQYLPSDTFPHLRHFRANTFEIKFPFDTIHKKFETKFGRIEKILISNDDDNDHDDEISISKRVTSSDLKSSNVTVTRDRQGE